MPWLSALVSVGTALLGANSARKRQKKADRDAAARDARANQLEEARLGLARNADARAQAAEQRYTSVMQPLEDAYIRRMSRPVDYQAEAALAGADVERQVGTQRGVLERTLRRRGLRAGDAAVADAESRLGLGAARLRAAAMTGARRNAVARTDQNAGLLAGMADRNFSRVTGLRGAADSAYDSTYSSAIGRLRDANSRADDRAAETADAYGALGDAVVGQGLPALRRIFG